ncbi:diaminohydroxyphosphoribosylaminopyrimidine deaminase [Niveispirillum sp. SYP-B3756]|uniref:2-oxo acid dehydrogenase subunit E2 n=1 Tax=Niveispirillum sp. SYP-B3756 TaxID=2662178 RepID=UPI001291D704|nr:2-oxo acid dehydrogenase subunit E2 [Niveispirillum sp. SYP-B3756]MQP64959.1 diaminohydroxyphosphoribosylaminopyrimidine deaminase [Niveispirillum sp. SYP-B3756]
MNAITPIIMPKWGLEMSEGTISNWHVVEGQSLSRGMEIVDIETAKIVNTLESDLEGTVRRLVAPVGQTLPVGALIAIVADAGVTDADIDRFIRGDIAAPQAEPARVDTRSQEVAEPVAVSDPDLERRNETVSATPIARRIANRHGVDLSRLTGTGRNGRINQEDVEAYLANHPASAPVNTAPAIIDNRSIHATSRAIRLANRLGIDLSRLSGTGRNGRVNVDNVERHAAASGLAPAPAAAPTPPAGPAARKLAADLGIPLSSVTPTGPKGHATKEDVRNAAASPPPAPAPTAASDLIPHSAMRRAIATALTAAKRDVPHFYLTADILMDDLLGLRGQLNAMAGPKISVNDFIVRAAALALGDVPDVNVQFTDEGMRRFTQANIAIAVAIEGGLVTPVLRDAGGKPLRTIAAEAVGLAARARDRRLTQQDLSDGSFAISNLGMFGIRHFQAIIAPPQAAILAVGATRREAQEASDGGVRFRSVMSVTLSCDHRAIDGAVGARFLAALRQHLEQPLGLLS